MTRKVLILTLDDMALFIEDTARVRPLSVKILGTMLFDLHGSRLRHYQGQGADCTDIKQGVPNAPDYHSTERKSVVQTRQKLVVLWLIALRPLQ